MVRGEVGAQHGVHLEHLLVRGVHGIAILGAGNGLHVVVASARIIVAVSSKIPIFRVLVARIAGGTHVHVAILVVVRPPGLVGSTFQ